MSMVVVLICLWLILKFGPEAKGVAFDKGKGKEPVSEEMQ